MLRCAPLLLVELRNYLFCFHIQFTVDPYVVHLIFTGFPKKQKKIDSQTHKFPFPGCLKIHLTTRCRSEIRNPRTQLYTRTNQQKKHLRNVSLFRWTPHKKRKPDPTLSRHETKLFSDLNSVREVSFCARRHLPTDCMHYRNSSTRVRHKHNRKLCYRFSNY